MPISFRSPTAGAASAFAACCVTLANAGEFFSAALRGANPDMLSGGLYAALAAEGAFGPPSEPPRARIGYGDLSKGRPPAVLDARVGVNTRLGDDPSPLPASQRGQAEAHIVRSVANPDLLLGTFQEGRFADAGAVNCGYAVSRDDGLTWTRALTPNLATASGGRYNRATDPVAGAGPQGDLYLQALASIQGAFALAAVVVSRSSDGGATWSAPATVFESTSGLLSPDKNWLAVNDYAGTPDSGRLVSTWTTFLRTATGAAISNPLVASISDDRGATWSPPSEITPQGSINQGTQPVFLPDGSLAVVYVTFLDPNDVTRFSIHVKRSIDGGRTFPAAANTVVSSVIGWDDPDLRDGIFLPSATVSRQTGDLFITYVAMVNGSPRVLVTKSGAQGATWSPPVAASDQPAGVSVMNPAIAVMPDGRTVSVVFMDKRNAPDGRNFVDHYAAHSFDGGATWQPNIRLTEMSSDIRFGPSTPRGVMLGDYLGIAPALAADQPCVAIWCDTRTGDSDPFVVRFAPAPQESFEAWRVARFTRSELANPAQSGHAADFDGDGHSNAAECLFQTDPRRAESGSAYDVHFNGSSFGANYRIRNLPELAIGSRWERSADGIVWATFQPGVTPGSGTLVHPTDDVGSLFDVPIGRSFYYRQIVSSAVIAETLVSLSDGRLVNLSTRGRSGAGASQLIAGFVIDGNKSMLVRAAGPALTNLGVAGALADPRLTLAAAAAADPQRSNDNWQQGGADAALFARLGAFPFANNSLDAALSLQLGAQSYTAIVSGANNAAAVALIEAYDADATPGAPANPRLLNLSTRGDAGTGDNLLIAGFVIAGTQPRRVLIRAVGPSLAQFGIASTLADPVLNLFQGNTVLATNDDWEISRSGAAVAATAQRVGAFPLIAASLDAALLLTLAPGAYTAVITGVEGGTGLALIEVYDAD